MFNIQDFKNGTTVGNNLFILVDDKDENNSFGFTDSIEKVTYNMKTIEPMLIKSNFYESFEKSTIGIKTTLVLGRFITILEVKKDKSHMSMTLFDFRISYETIDKALKSLVSDSVLTQIKKIKYEYEEFYNDTLDVFELNTFLEPKNED